MEQDLQKIIHDGVLAPSGENCQPWKFVIHGNSVSIYNVPEADQSLYNHEQKGSYVSHGAVIENMEISASHYGYKTSVEVFPDESKPDLVSILIFTKKEGGDVEKTDLYQSLEKRCTNRKDHAPQKLSPEQKSQLINCAKTSGFGELKIVDVPQELEILGHALAINEQIIFENKKLHDFFYEHLLWKEDEQHKAGGFYIKTLEFLPQQLKGVKLFKSWGILNVLNKIGKVSKMIAKDNAKKYAHSGALVAVVIPYDTKKDFVNAGRLSERIWLTATKLGLAVHPCTGVLYFMERIKGGDAISFKENHVTLIKKGYNDIIQIFGVPGKTIPMLFRIGYAEEPSARAMRMKPHITLN